ncbi:putative calcium-binding CML20 [Chlorella sorokiniana]|uniref:Calcium-binding CML20 n=1 Tax=Chlorella sorokiniana TaxID=3076 RepID=A0A2P6TNJ6_CHLSO|nr:putative calcium-binding CML20 [Chlorella sorokiniana]|eukprot:PRW50910.1 putative calcium-binding CML20 [Chlorella sorokiniana]
MAAAGADTHKLVSQLPPDTAESVLAWLASRGKDLPVHIPVKTIRFARECFQLIDTDGSGTLEPGELRAVFTALGRPASLRQVSRLVESVAGAGATSLRFSDFAQMMHGAVSTRRREEAELHALMQADVNLGGQAGGGGDAEDEPPLQWTDFHLLAKAFRRRVVVNGVINNSAGWREKVLSLAERQAANSRAATANAASLEAECSRRRQHTQQMRQQTERPVGQAQRRRLAALALVRGGPDSV